MSARGLKTKYGRIYTPESMKKLLTRRFYIGRLEWQGKEYKGNHKPIIARELFHRVQEVMSKRSVDTGEKGKLEFLLRGVAYCQVCNRRLTGEVHIRGSYYRCLPGINREKCHQPYIPVKHLDSQLEALYERLQPSRKLLELLKLEMQEIAKRRKRIVEKEIKTLKRIIQDLENKELKLLDEMLGKIVARGIYEKLSKRYTQKRKEAETRLNQLEVDYDDPLDFLDKYILISSMLSYLHQRFNYEQRKNLFKAIFERIYVRDKAIVEVKLNTPFSFLLKEDIQNLFKDHPTGHTKEDVFEQMKSFVLSEQYAEVRSLVDLLVEKAEALQYVGNWEEGLRCSPDGSHYPN